MALRPSRLRSVAAPRYGAPLTPTKRCKHLLDDAQSPALPLFLRELLGACALPRLVDLVLAALAIAARERRIQGALEIARPEHGQLGTRPPGRDRLAPL